MANDWLNLNGKISVVTGGGMGIGRGIALSLAEAGCRVFVIDLNEKAAQETVETINKAGMTEAVAHAVDTSKPAQVSAAAERLRKVMGPADILVNNAGIVGKGDLADGSLETWQRIIDVNLTGYLLCSREFGRDMIKRGSGSVVHVTSIVSQHAYPGVSAYSPSKAGATMLARQLALEWSAHGVRSNAVAPGLIRTPMTEAAYTSDAARKAREKLVPLGRIGTPQDIADAVLWFASDRSSYVTGQQILVDGGLEQTVLRQLQVAPF